MLLWSPEIGSYINHLIPKTPTSRLLLSLVVLVVPFLTGCRGVTEVHQSGHNFSWNRSVQPILLEPCVSLLIKRSFRNVTFILPIDGKVAGGSLHCIPYSISKKGSPFDPMHAWLARAGGLNGRSSIARIVPNWEYGGLIRTPKL